MTLSSTNNKESHTGNGSNTEFTFQLLFFAEEDLTVILRATDGTETVQVLNTDYTVSGAGSPGGGTVTMTVAPAGAPNPDTLVILREVAATQGVDYRAGDPFPADTHETAIDRLTMLVQQIQEELTRTPSVSKTDQATSLVLPNELQRASKFFAFDASGNAIASSSPTGDSSIPVSAYFETLLDDLDVDTALGTLGFSTFVKSLKALADASAFADGIEALKYGKHTINAQARAWRARDTNGCGTLNKTESSTNKVMTEFLPFDKDNVEYAQLSFKAPKSANESIGLSGTIEWKEAASATAHGCRWEVQMQAQGDGDDIDGAWSTVVSVNDTGAAGKRQFAPFTAVVPEGTWAEGNQILIQLSRKADDGTNDTLDVDAHFIEMQLELTLNAGSDD